MPLTLQARRDCIDRCMVITQPMQTLRCSMDTFIYNHGIRVPPETSDTGMIISIMSRLKIKEELDKKGPGKSSKNKSFDRKLKRIQMGEHDLYF